MQNFKESFVVFMDKGELKGTFIGKNIYNCCLVFIGLQI